MAKKPTIRSGNKRGSDLFNSFLEGSDDLSSRTRRSVARSNTSRDTVDLSIQESERAISNLRLKLEMLEKGNPNYQQLKKSLTQDIELEKARIESNKKLKELLKASSVLLLAVTDDYKKRQSIGASGVNTAKLANVARQIIELQNSTDEKLVEIEDLYSSLKNTVDADQMRKIEKRLERFEAVFANPLQRSGAVGAGTKTILTGLLGPLGEIADEVFNISGGFERKLTQGLAKKLWGKKGGKSEGSEVAEHLREQVEHVDEKADKIITLLTEEEQEETLEDRKEEIRARRDKLLAARKNKQKDKEQKGWLSSFMSRMFGGKLSKILSFTKFLSPRGFGMLLTRTLFGGGKLLARIGGTLGRMILSPLLSGASTLLFRLLPSLVAALPGFLSTVLNPAALLAAAGFAGFKLGDWLYEKYSMEILDSIDWVVQKVTGAWEKVKSFLPGNWFSDDDDDGPKLRTHAQVKAQAKTNSTQSTSTPKTNSVNPPAPPKRHPDKTATTPSTLSNFAWNGVNAVTGYSKDEIVSFIKNAAQTIGVPESWLYSTAVQESALNPKAKAPTSSATGLFQFINSTWSNMVSKYGSKYGIGMGDRENPQASAIMGALFMRDNINTLQSAGLPVNYSSVYGAHFLGSGDIKKLLSANPGEKAANLFPEAARANKNVFYNKDNTPRTVSDVLAFFGAKLKSMGATGARSTASVSTSHQGSAVTTSSPGRPITNTSNTIIMPQQSSQPSSAPATSIGGGMVNMDQIPMYPKDSEALIGVVLGQLA